MKKLFRISTVPSSLNILLRGQLRYLNQYYKVTAISGSGKDLEEVEGREGVKTYIIEMQRQISPLKDLVSLYKLYVYFKKEKPDIVHSITPKAGLLSMIAAKFAGVPLRMHTFTGLLFPTKTGFKKHVLIATDRVLAYCATTVTPEGEGVRRDLEKYEITRKPLQIIGPGNVNGIDLDYFNRNQIAEIELQILKRELEISEKDFIFIFVGRLVKDKGINELVAAFKMLCEDYEIQNFTEKKIKLLLVGPTEQHLDPLDAATLKEIEENASIFSVNFQQDVRPFFALSNVLIFPSYREGFPSVILQALAMGIPVIASDINGCREIITPEQNGWLLPVKNVLLLKEKMLEISENSEVCVSMNGTCRESVLQYDKKEVWEALRKVYKSYSQKS